MNNATKHMLQGAGVTLLAIVGCVGGGYTLGKMQTRSYQEVQTHPMLKELKEAEVITAKADREMVQTQENHALVPVTTFCWRKMLYMQVNQGNATWGDAVLNPVTGKPENCGE